MLVRVSQHTIPAETWTPPGREPLTDGDGHPLTWAVVHHAHATLVRHASCGGALSRWGPTTDAGRDVNTGYDSSDGRPCPCRWHETLSDELGVHRDTCAAWPGPICGTCWAASCPCGYVFENAADAAGRDSLGRLGVRGRAAGVPPTHGLKPPVRERGREREDRDEGLDWFV